jgi:transposase
MDSQEGAKMRREVHMGRRKRRRFTSEFKLETVRLVKQGNRSVGQVCKDLDLSETAVRSWLAQYEIDNGRGPAGALTTGERAEFEHLRRENRQLKMERDIQKKRRPSSPRKASEVRLHSGGEGQLPNRDDVQGPSSVPRWLLRVEYARAKPTSEGE